MELFTILASIATVIAAIVVITTNGHAARSANAAVTSAAAAETSAKEAGRSADSAESSVELARSERDRSTEQSDVAWELTALEPGMIQVRNVGLSTAYAVAAIVRVEGVRHDYAEDEVLSDGVIKCDASKIARRKFNDDVNTAEDMANHSILYEPSPLRVEVRVTWQTKLGTPFVVAIGE